MKVFAHRGASAYAPENTMPAFEMAFRMGACGIELDTQFSRDGIPVVIHDFTLERVSAVKGAVRDYNASELAAIDVGGKLFPAFAGTGIPILKEVLEWIKPLNMILNIEIKSVPSISSEGLAEKVVSLVGACGLRDRVIISSFDHRCLFEVKKLDAGLPVGLLYVGGLLETGVYAAGCKADFIHPQYSFTDAKTKAECDHKGVGMNVWTVDDPAEALRLKAIGAAGIITNKPDVILNAVGR